MKYDCIMPAAGLSSRMGQWKLLLDYNGKTIIENAISNAAGFTNNIFVSGGYRITELKDLIGENDQIQIIENAHYQKGMLTSIKAALPFIKTSKFFISLSDMPLIPRDIYLQMSFTNFSDALFPVFNKRRGHPVLVDTKLKEKIMSAPDSWKMKDVLKDCDVSELKVESDGIFFDVDTKEDYRNLLKL